MMRNVSNGRAGGFPGIEEYPPLDRMREYSLRGFHWTDIEQRTRSKKLTSSASIFSLTGSFLEPTVENIDHDDDNVGDNWYSWWQGEGGEGYTMVITYTWTFANADLCEQNSTVHHFHHKKGKKNLFMFEMCFYVVAGRRQTVWCRPIYNRSAMQHSFIQSSAVQCPLNGSGEGRWQ